MLNGFLVAKAKIPPLIVTLGTLGMALGIAQLITDGVDVRSVPFELIDTIGTGDAVRPASRRLVLIAAVVALIGGVVLAVTRFGRYTYAIGSNVEARAARRHQRRPSPDQDLRALGGLLAGLAGFLSLARFGTTSIARPLDRQPGRHRRRRDRRHQPVRRRRHDHRHRRRRVHPGRAANGFVIVGVQPFWQQVAVGAVLIAAVYSTSCAAARYAR